MRLDFALTLVSLTAFYGLVFVLFGSSLLDVGRQRQLSYATAGLGFLLLYPLVTTLVVWIAPSWVFVILCATTFALWVRVYVRHRARVVQLLGSSARHALVVSAVAFLFWIPGMLGPTSGLFTEGGGDFTIYAGLPAKLGDHPLWTVSQEEVGPFRLKSRPLNADGSTRLSARANPPSAGWSVNRIIELGWGSRNPGWYSLQHMLFRASWGPVELQYLAMLAVIWAIIVLSLQRLVRLRYGRAAGLLALLVLIASQELTSVGYNHYLPQLIATALVASTVFLLALPDAIALPRAARAGAAVLCIAFVGIAYYPLLPAAVVPLVLLVGLWPRLSNRPSQTAPRDDHGLAWKACVYLGATYLVVNVAALYAAQVAGIKDLVSRFVAGGGQSAAVDLTFLLKPRPYNLAWVDSLLGGFPIQMLPPYATVDPSRSAAAWFLVAANAMLAVGLVFGTLRRRQARRSAATDQPLRRPLSEEGRFGAAFAVALILFLAIEVVLGRKYQYTQFKGTAYVMPFMLLGGVVAASRMINEQARRLRAFTVIAAVMLIGSLVYFRVDGAMRIAAGRDQTALLDPNVTALAGDIQAKHPEAFVLGFPAHPSEYALWEFGLRDERGLILRYFNYPASRESYVPHADLRHLWVLEDAPDREQHPGKMTRGAVSAYPATTGSCSVRAAVLHADGTQTVPFAPMGASTPMWLDTDIDYWIFDAKHTSRLEVLVKQNQALHGRRVAAELLFPVERKLSLHVTKLDDQDALAYLSTGELAPSGLVVLRIPGYGYSDVRCS